MNITRLIQVRRLFNNDTAPRTTARHNMRAWVRAVRHLDTGWVLHPSNSPVSTQ